jgi:hypothetical protein
VLARRSSIFLPSGIELRTPLLIPSFSSKGFAVSDDGESAVAEAVLFALPLIPGACLVSAYDIHYDHLPEVDGFFDLPRSGVYGNPEVIVLDSGGYERRPELDLADTHQENHEPREWNSELLYPVIDRIPPDSDTIVVSLDKPGIPVTQQAEAASEFFGRCPTLTRDFLVKPPTPTRKYVDPQHIVDAAPFLGEFAIIGVTEKELGNSLLNRLTTLAATRQALDAAGISAPIHVFGSLDPLVTLLYFTAGGEVFDGLSWLRYAYHSGLAVYGEALAVVNRHWVMNQNQRRGTMIANNLALLDDLTIRMQRFVLTEGDFAVFGDHAQVVEDGYEAMRAQLRRNP